MGALRNDLQQVILIANCAPTPQTFLDWEWIPPPPPRPLIARHHTPSLLQLDAVLSSCFSVSEVGSSSTRGYETVVYGARLVARATINTEV